jgi:hypothetical protein
MASCTAHTHDHMPAAAGATSWFERVQFANAKTRINGQPRGC